MVIDTSAVVAILFGAPEAEIFAEAIERAAVRLMSAASVLKAAVRARRDVSAAQKRF